jgi:hypothetical protein
VRLFQTWALVCATASCSLLIDTERTSDPASTADAALTPDTGYVPPNIDAGDAASASPYAAQVLADRPSAYWRMDATSGSIVKDRSGNNNDLALRGAGHVLGVAGALAGEANGAIRFDGLTSSAAALRSNDLPFASGRFTFECWLKWAGKASYYQMIFSKSSGSGGGRRGYLFLASDNENSTRFELSADPNGAITGTYRPAFEVFEQHWVISVDQGVPTQFRNGKQVSRAPAAGSVPAILGEFTLGVDNNGTDSPLNGTIDEVAIYDHVLDVVTVAKHYNLGKGME